MQLTVDWSQAQTHERGKANPAVPMTDRHDYDGQVPVCTMYSTERYDHSKHYNALSWANCLSMSSSDTAAAAAALSPRGPRRAAGASANYTHAHIHKYRFSSSCNEVEDHISQHVEPRNFPQPRNVTLLHKFYLTTTQILEYTPT